MKHTMWRKYGEIVMNDIVDSLIGSCTMGSPDLSWFSIPEEDWDDVMDQIDEYVYECASCGWWCDGADRYLSETYGADVCEECKEDEDNE